VILLWSNYIYLYIMLLCCIYSLFFNHTPIFIVCFLCNKCKMILIIRHFRSFRFYIKCFISKIKHTYGAYTKKDNAYKINFISEANLHHFPPLFIFLLYILTWLSELFK